MRSLNPHVYRCLVTTMLVWLQLSHAQRCVHSGMCSLGRLKPFVGDISDSASLKAAAAARSYKNETILHMVYAGNLLNAKLLVGNWAKLGISHIMLLGDSKATCETVAAQIPQIGCVWDTLSSTLRSVPAMSVAWMVRYRTMARLVRMGYNVLMSDTDIVVFDDPYRYLKATPFKQYTIISQAEVLIKDYTYITDTAVNSGLIYVQNARRDGVAAWLLAEVTDRFLRWAEDGYQLLTSKGVSKEACVGNQDALTDALSSVATGRPHFLQTIKSFWQDTPAQEISAKVQGEVDGRWQLTEAFLPHFMHLTAGGSKTAVKYLDMVFPHTGGQWPEEYGGRWYPEKRGQLSEAFLKLLQDDCDGCPLWPDVENPATESAARAVPREQYLMAPPWFMGNYNARGSNGSWLPDDLGHVQQVMGHAHWIPGSDGTSQLVFRQLVNQYDWATAEQHWSTPWVFQANFAGGSQSTAEFLPTLETQPGLPRLLVMYSRMRLNKLTSLEEYLAVLHGAMQVAALSNRTLVWPDVPCTAPVVGASTPTGGLQIKSSNLWLAHGTRRDSLKCMLMSFLNSGCLMDRRGMLGTEFAHFVERYGVAFDLDPNKGNVAFFPSHSEVHSTLDTRQGPGPVLVQVTERDARQHMQSLDRAQVVFLAHPVKVYGVELPKLGCLDSQAVSELRKWAGVTWAGSTSLKWQDQRGWIVDGRLTIVEPSNTTGLASTGSSAATDIDTGLRLSADSATSEQASQFSTSPPPRSASQGREVIIGGQRVYVTEALEVRSDGDGQVQVTDNTGSQWSRTSSSLLRAGPQGTADVPTTTQSSSPVVDDPRAGPQGTAGVPTTTQSSSPVVDDPLASSSFLDSEGDWYEVGNRG